MCGLQCSGPTPGRCLMWPFAIHSSTRIVAAPTVAGAILGALISRGTFSFESPVLGAHVAYVSLLERSFLHFIDWGSLSKLASCRGRGCSVQLIQWK